MKHLFTNQCLQIGLNKRENKLILTISSDYSGSNRKSQLYVNEKRLSDEVLQFWKSIKTKKLTKMNLSFGEIDWYDDMTDIYDTPIIVMERGLRKCKVGSHEHGSIPKEWSIDTTFVFTDLSTKKPILDVIKLVLGSYFTPKMEKDFNKNLNPVVVGKIPSGYISSEE